MWSAPYVSPMQVQVRGANRVGAGRLIGLDSNRVDLGETSKSGQLG